MTPKVVYLSLGSNLGDREEQINRALSCLSEHMTIRAKSSLFETEPRDFTAQPWFLNMAIAGETRLFPLQLLGVLQTIERRIGRIRGAQGAPKGPRKIDLDLLLYGDWVIKTERLEVPHPRMLQRRFVLEPLDEIAPELRYPGTAQSLRFYLGKVKDQRVSRVGPQYP